MPCRFSVRDITYTVTEDGVRIVVETDVKVSLHLRLTEQQPWIHKQPRFRRGLWLNDDVRFCFTVYTDYEQYEQWESTTHTFWMENWPVCTTKWLYFWGTVAGQACVSTSPIFKYHNDGVSPIPGVDKMYSINSVTPQKILGLGIGTWQTYSLAGHVSPDATGVVLVAVNSDAGQQRSFGVRPKGATGFSNGSLRLESMTGAFVKLDANLEFEMLVGINTVVYVYIMGFTGPNFVWLDTPVDLHPAVDGVWKDLVTSQYAPGAQAVLLSCGAGAALAAGFKIRVNGSIDNRWCGNWHTYPCIGVDSNGVFQEWLSPEAVTRGHTDLIGYVTSNFEKHVDAKDVSPLNADVWEAVDVHDIVASPPWVSLMLYESTGAHLFGMRKAGTFFDEKWHSSGGEWMLVHANPDHECDLWLPLATRKFYLHGEFHPTQV